MDILNVVSAGAAVGFMLSLIGRSHRSYSTEGPG